MVKDKSAYKAQKPIPRQSLWQSFWYDAEGYTQQELRLREKILVLRQHSGMEPELLQTDDPWFDEDTRVSFYIKNEDSWFLNTEYIPRSRLSRDSFRIALPKQQPMWHGISVLRLKTSDFLLKRSEQHPDTALNEPFHFAYRDLVKIFTRLGNNPDTEYVANQLPFVSQYLQQLSTLVADPKSSDKLFLEDCRMQLQTVLNQDISIELNSQKFGNVLSKLQIGLEKLGEQYHTVLHFALTDREVNDHPYWDYFIDGESVKDIKAFPTLAGRNCQTSQISDSKNSKLYVITTPLPHCPQLRFLPDTTLEQQQLYLDSLKHLQELLRFKRMLGQVQTLTREGGEVFTKLFFRNDLLNLFNQVEQFFIKSHDSMVNLLAENDKLRHSSVVELNQIRWWEKLWSNKEGRLQSYLTNQNNFSRFQVNQQSLQKHLDKVIELVIRTTTQLRTPQIDSGGESQEVFYLQSEAKGLLHAIYNWRMEQNTRLGLPLPQRPRLLGELPAQPSVSKISLESEDNTDESGEEIEYYEETDATFQNSRQSRLPLTNSQPLMFFSPTQPAGIGGPQRPMVTNNAQNFCPAPYYSGNSNAVSFGSNATLALLAGLPGLLILGLMLYAYFTRKSRQESQPELDSEEDNRQDFGESPHPA